MIIVGASAFTIILIIVDLIIIKNEDIFQGSLFNEYSKESLFDSYPFVFQFFCCTSCAIASFCYQSIVDFLKRDSTIYKDILVLYERGLILNVIFLEYLILFAEASNPLIKSLTNLHYDNWISEQQE